MHKWTPERIAMVDRWLLQGYTVEQVAKSLGVSKASIEGVFHRLLLQGAVAFGEENAIPALASRYGKTEKEIRSLLAEENRVASIAYRQIVPWQPSGCDILFALMSAALFLGVVTSHAAYVNGTAFL